MTPEELKIVMAIMEQMRQGQTLGSVNALPVPRLPLYPERLPSVFSGVRG
jgi:hypothetical protein